jgi:hypothetical protein
MKLMRINAFPHLLARQENGRSHLVPQDDSSRLGGYPDGRDFPLPGVGGGRPLRGMLNGGGGRRDRVALQHVLLLLVHVAHVPAAAHAHTDLYHDEVMNMNTNPDLRILMSSVADPGSGAFLAPGSEIRDE